MLKVFLLPVAVTVILFCGCKTRSQGSDDTPPVVLTSQTEQVVQDTSSSQGDFALTSTDRPTEASGNVSQTKPTGGKSITGAAMGDNKNASPLKGTGPIDSKHNDAPKVFMGRTAVSAQAPFKVFRCVGEALTDRDYFVARYGNGVWGTAMDGSSDRRIQTVRSQASVLAGFFEIGVYGNGLYSTDVRNGTYRRLSEAIPTSVYVNSQYTVGIYGNGVYKYNNATGAWTRLYQNIPNSVQMNNRYVVTTWANGLWADDLVDGSWVRLESVVPSASYMSNQYLIGTFGNGVYSYNLESAVWRRLSTVIPDLIFPNNNCVAI